MGAAFRHGPNARRVLELALVGHLTRAFLDVALERVDASMSLPAGASKFDLVVDARRMTGYDAAARARFVEWNAASKARLAHVAVLTENVLWHMVVAAMSVASGQPMRAFSTSSEAHVWFEAV